MDRIMTSINKHLNDSDFSVDMIADEVGISRVHLYRKMKELTGQTPHDFIRQIKLKQAATLLASKKMNISEVVYACVFSNAASFSTMSKSVYGISPPVTLFYEKSYTAFFTRDASNLKYF